MRLSPLLLLAASLALGGCGSDDQPQAGPAADGTQSEQSSDGPFVPVEVSTDLTDSGGSVLGTAWFREANGRAAVEVQVAGLTPGYHPMYLYSDGTCDLDGTTIAASDLSELPPLLVLDNGVGSMTTLAGPVSLDDLLVDDGTALFIAPAVAALADLPPVPDGADGSSVTGSEGACGAVER